MADVYSMGSDNNNSKTFQANLAAGNWESVALSDDAFTGPVDAMDTSSLLEGIKPSLDTIQLWSRDGSRYAA